MFHQNKVTDLSILFRGDALLRIYFNFFKMMHTKNRPNYMTGTFDFFFAMHHF